MQAPPPPPLWARPSSTSTPTTTTVSASAGTSQRSSGITSYPPACHTTSHAHDIANYFSRQEEWKDAWFTTESPLPPSLVGRNDMTWTCSWRTSGSQKTLTGAALFCDLSVVWWQVDWDTSHERRPGFASQVQRRARYLDCPEHLEAEQLWYACSTYGEQVATFAEQAEAAGLPIGHGKFDPLGVATSLRISALQESAGIWLARPWLPSRICHHQFRQYRVRMVISFSAGRPTERTPRPASVAYGVA